MKTVPVPTAYQIAVTHGTQLDIAAAAPQLDDEHDFICNVFKCCTSFHSRLGKQKQLEERTINNSLNLHQILAKKVLMFAILERGTVRPTKK